MVTALLCIATPSLAIQNIQVEPDIKDIKNFLTVVDQTGIVDLGNEPEEVVARQPVSVRWGVPDTTALVGKLFHYLLPKDAFRGDITGYEVRRRKRRRAQGGGRATFHGRATPLAPLVPT